MTTHRNRTASTALGAVLAGSLLLGACTGGTGGADDDPTTGPTDGTTSESPSTDPSTPADGQEPSPSDDETSSPGEPAPPDEDDDAPVPFPANTAPDTQDASADAMLTVREIRTGRHEGYDRVVFELGGTGTPGWLVEYVPEATEDGSGRSVDVDGDAVLEVRISGSGYPADTGVEEYSGANPLDVEDGAVEEVVLRGVYEGITQAFVGVDDERPFRVFALEDPARVVLDVRVDD